MRSSHPKGRQFMKLSIVCCASLLLLSAMAAEATVLPGQQTTSLLQRRSLSTTPAAAPAVAPAAAPTTPSVAPTQPAARTPPSLTAASSAPSRPSNPRACQKLPITPTTWKLLDIDHILRNLPGGQNMTISQYAAANGAANFVCGNGENCNAGQLCRPVKAPAWQILYATQEYNSFLNALTDSINYSLSQLQAISASMAQDLTINTGDSQFAINFKYIFTDMYRGIAYGATALFLIILVAPGPLAALSSTRDILSLTAFGAGLAAWIQGAPQTASFVPWSKISFYISQAQGALAARIAEATEKGFNTGINAQNGLAKILADGHFFTPPTPAGLMENTQKSILYVVQARLLARLLRGQNAYVVISPDNCQGKGPDGAREGGDVLSYCDPKEKLLYNVVRAHNKKTINTVEGGSAVVNKYGFSAEFIVRNSWKCQKKYGTFEHDVFADPSKVSPEDIMSLDCIVNLPVCDMREQQIRELKFSKHKTTTVACRKGGGLPI